MKYPEWTVGGNGVWFRVVRVMVSHKKMTVITREAPFSLFLLNR